MIHITDFAEDVYSQFGDDGIIAHIFSVIGEGDKVCVEFGAGDGQSCSQTANLWINQGWKAVLVEADEQRFGLLEQNAAQYDTICVHTTLTPEGPGSISAILHDHGFTSVDFMSIDIDGDDYFHAEGLVWRPRVLCVEFNPTIPPFLDLRDALPGGTFGQSFQSLFNLLVPRGYRFVGASYANAFFVVEEESSLFDSYDTSFEPRTYTYAVTDYNGRVVLVGDPLPWDPKQPYVRPLASSSKVFPVTNDKEWIRTGFEALWGETYFVSLDGLSRTRLQDLLNDKHALVLLDLWNANMEAVEWIWDCARHHGYEPILHARVLGLVRKDKL